MLISAHAPPPPAPNPRQPRLVELGPLQLRITQDRSSGGGLVGSILGSGFTIPVLSCSHVTCKGLRHPPSLRPPPPPVVPSGKEEAGEMEGKWW